MFPIRDSIPSRHFPIMNWAIILLNAAIFIFQIRLPENQLVSFYYHFGLVPARYTQPGWASEAGLPTNNFLPFLTNIFLHGGWFHILSNMWVLFIFGDNVEGRMGPLRYLAFYLLCGLGASATHFFLFSHSQVPVMGASGAIAGVMAAYMFLFPFSRITFLFPLFFIPLFFTMHAFYFVAIWFLLQLASGMVDLARNGHSTGIAFWAHIGGFAAGTILFRFFLSRKRRRVTA